MRAYLEIQRWMGGRSDGKVNELDEVNYGRRDDIQYNINKKRKRVKEKEEGEAEEELENLRIENRGIEKGSTWCN